LINVPWQCLSLKYFNSISVSSQANPLSWLISCLAACVLQFLMSHHLHDVLCLILSQPSPKCLASSRVLTPMYWQMSLSRTKKSWLHHWNTLPLPVEICQLPADHFKSHLNSIHFSWSADSFLFLSYRTALFLSKWQFCGWWLHSFLDMHLLTHSWCDIARHQAGTSTGRRSTNPNKP